MSSSIRIASLILLVLVSVARAKLEIRSPFIDTFEDYKSNFANLVDSNSTNDDICSTSLAPNESFAYNVSENVTSGYLNIGTGTASSLFFIFYKCRNLNSSVNPASTGDFSSVPVVIWLQGGPGSSSLLGGFVEKIGPTEVVWNPTTEQLEERALDRSWNDFYNILIIENPVGVGFGNLADVNDLTQNETRVAEHMLNALLNFYTNSNFSNFSSLRNTPLYIFGESYAGHYIPPICDRILRYNSQTPGFKIPLKGAGIGNGWVDPPNQLSEFGLYGYALGLLDEDERATVEGAQLDAVFSIAKGRAYLSQGNYDAAAPYMANALQNFGVITGTIVNGGGNVNVYNYRIFGKYNNTNLATYLNLNSTKQHYCTRGTRLGNSTWSQSSPIVYSKMSYYDFMDIVTANVSNVLNSLPILFYNGQDDIICNSPSTQTLLSKLPWANQDAFYNANTQVWLLNNGTHAGFAKNYGTLTYVAVNKAGHLAPMDQIDSTTEMLRRFIAGSKNWTAPFLGEAANRLEETEFLIKADIN